jgi:hypothetical protein
MRFQYLGRHILNRLAEPGMIAGMGVAEVVAGAVTVRALGWFAAESASFWTRGFVANSAAAVAAFPAEALSFWGVNRGVNQLLHPESQSWDKKVLMDELISLSSGLAFLKIGGAATQGIFDLAHGFNPVTGDIARLSTLARVTRPFARQLGMFNGIAVGQYVDNKYGAAPKLSNDTFWANTFSTLLDFNLAGHFSHALLGTRHADLMQKMAFLTQKTKMRNEGSLLQKFLLPGFRAVTPEGIEFRIEDEKSLAAAENSFQMANGAERGNGKKRRGISLTPARERARVAHTLEGLLRTYRSGDLHLSEKSKFGSGLFPDIDKVEEVLHQMVRKDRKLEPDPKKRLTKDDVAGVLQSIRMRYFESISDKLLDFSEKFNFLRNALKEKLQTSSEEERDEVISLLDSVELKYLEATRYFHAAENYLGDNKGPTEDSFFSKSKFGKLLDNFNFHNLRFTQFLERKPILRELLAAYEGKITPRYNNPIDRQMILEDLLALEQKGVPSDLTLPLKEIFETIDSSVITAELSPFSELFRFLTGEINTDDFFARYQPLQDYLEVLVELRTHLSSKMIDELSLFPWQISEDLPHIQEVTKKDLLTELVGKMPVDQAEAFVDRYFVTCNELSQILASFRPPERNVMIPWPEVKSHLLRVQERGILKPETVAKLLDWSEGTEEQPHHGVIFGIRSEMVAGIIDFIMKDPLSPEARKEVVDFLDEVARRDDLRMMEVLAFPKG